MWHVHLKLPSPESDFFDRRTLKWHRNDSCSKASTSEVKFILWRLYQKAIQEFKYFHGMVKLFDTFVLKCWHLVIFLPNVVFRMTFPKSNRFVAATTDQLIVVDKNDCIDVGQMASDSLTQRRLVLSFHHTFQTWFFSRGKVSFQEIRIRLISDPPNCHGPIIRSGRKQRSGSWECAGSNVTLMVIQSL